jgi:hydroxycarboxylate dehydrogenase B
MPHSGTLKTLRVASLLAPSRLVDLVTLLLMRAGADPQIAEEVAENLVEADALGHRSHGIRLLGSYAERLRAGTIDGRAWPAVASRSSGLIKVDGHHAFGQIVGRFAAEEGAKAAREHGVAIVATTNAGQFGRNGKWPEIAAARGVASIHFVNSTGSPPVIVPHGAREARLGSNPIALGVPQPDGPPIIVDFSVGEMAINAVRRVHELGDRLPSRFVVRADGSLSDDPSDFVGSPNPAMLPFGGYKGYALAMFAELFAGAITGGGCQGGDEALQTRSNNMLSIYIDPNAFVGADVFEREVRSLTGWVRKAAPADPRVPVSIPGDRARQSGERAREIGSEIDASLRKILLDVAAGLGATAAVEEALDVR